MKLFFKKTGEGRALIILHGLFGMGDNWNTIAKQLSEKGFGCYCVDLRNHGRSPHSIEFNYKVMTEDIAAFMSDEKITRADFIGHSMGGKVAMFFARDYPERVGRMIVVDISPRYYPPHHQTIIAALQAFDPASLEGRKEAEEILRVSIKDESTVQFLLKNLYWNSENKLDWRFGLREIESNMEAVGEEFSSERELDTEIMFMRGERSGYVSDDDVVSIKNIFPRAKIITIQGAGHWIHADNPQAFLKEAEEFLR